MKKPNSFRVWDIKTRRYSDDAFFICSAGDLWESIYVQDSERNQLIVEPVDEKRFKVERFSEEQDKTGKPAYINDVFAVLTPDGYIPCSLIRNSRTSSLIFNSLTDGRRMTSFCGAAQIIGTTHDGKKKLLKAASNIEVAEKATT